MIWIVRLFDVIKHGYFVAFPQKEEAASTFLRQPVIDRRCLDQTHRVTVFERYRIQPFSELLSHPCKQSRSILHHDRFWLEILHGVECCVMHVKVARSHTPPRILRLLIFAGGLVGETQSSAGRKRGDDVDVLHWKLVQREVQKRHVIEVFQTVRVVRRERAAPRCYPLRSIPEGLRGPKNTSADKRDNMPVRIRHWRRLPQNPILVKSRTSEPVTVGKVAC